MLNIRGGDSTLFAMTEVEHALMDPDDHSTVTNILTRLEELAAEIAAYQATGPLAHDYHQAKVIGEAIAAARRVVVRLAACF
jgi:hypothetical protein